MTADVILTATVTWTFWNVLALLLLVVPPILLAAIALIDLFGRQDTGRWEQAGWALGIVLVPLAGSILYLLLGPRRSAFQEEPVKSDQTVQPAFQRELTRADQLQMLAYLHEAGKLTDGEFARAKVRVLRDDGLPISR